MLCKNLVRIPGRLHHNVCIPDNIPEHKAEFTALPDAENISGAPEFQILFRDIKSVIGLFQDFEALWLLRQIRRIQKNAVALPASASDPSAELMQLGKSEALRVFYDNDCRVRNVYADFDYSR